MTEAAAAIITAIVSALTAWLAYKRSKRAQSKDEELALRRVEIRADELSQQQIAVLTEAYRELLDQLREEINRLVSAHKDERQRWEQKEDQLREKIQELREKVAYLSEKVEHVERDMSNYRGGEN